MLVALVQSRVVGFELGDELAARGGVGGGGDFGRGRREEFALLEFDAFPGWVADDAVEAGRNVGQPPAIRRGLNRNARGKLKLGNVAS